MKKHTKHTNLTRRENGNFAPNEIAILGTKCGVIADLVQQVSKKLSKYSLAYFDASHAKDVEHNQLSEFVFHHEGNLEIKTASNVNKFLQRLQFAQYDYVFINGNHYAGSKQIIFLDPEKENSIKKRIEQLNDVQFFISMQEGIEVFDCLKEKYSNYTEMPVYLIDDVQGISSHLKNLVEKELPKLSGLVLIGGKSTRMGTDKSQLSYHGLPQSDYAVQLLESKGLETFVSVRADQKAENHKIITDAFLGLGPFGAICSAFMKNPNDAYLVLATDLPYVSDEVLNTLLKNRNPKKIATAIKGKSAKFMEPLITIWEPKAYPILLSYLSQGYSCPRKILINSDVEIIEVEDALIRNVNTPEEFKKVKKELNTLK